MLDKIKEEPQGVAVVDLLRPEGVLVLVKYSAKITRFNSFGNATAPLSFPHGK